MVWLKTEKPTDACWHFQISGGIFRYLQILLEYSRRFHICDTVTTPEVRIRRVFVWRLLETMEGEAIACLGKWLGLKLRLVGRWNNRKSHYSVSETRRGIRKV